MSIKAIDIFEVRDFVSKYDADDDKTIFKIGVLDSRIRAELTDNTTSFEISSTDPDGAAKTSIGLNKLAIDAVRYGLKGFENFQDSEGNQVKFNTKSESRFGRNYNVVSASIINMMPFNILKEISDEILNDNNLSEIERKN